MIQFFLYFFQYCYNAAISACGKSGQWQRSKELLVVMRERGVPPDLISYNSAIDACGKGGRWVGSKRQWWPFFCDWKENSRVTRAGVTDSAYTGRRRLASRNNRITTPTEKERDMMERE